MSPIPEHALDTLRHLRSLHNALSDHPGADATGRYAVPSCWLPQGGDPGPVDVDPFAFYAGVTRTILDSDAVPLIGTGARGSGGGAWSAEAVVYNLMVRLTCAYDHDGDGVIAPANPGGWREGGSFLKAIAILPYVRSLGANTLHLLPVQEIGQDGRRGSLGSPYAVRDPMAFDQALGEPNTGLTLDSQFAAFVEAARHSGFRIILELPLRTLSKDCVWVKDHPEWFYWIAGDTSFHPPTFTKDEIRVASEKIAGADHDDLPPPSQEYREMFAEPPDPKTVRRIGERWTGSTPAGQTIVIPGAFADWPPDDHQPVWEDITYLKYFQDDRFNYPAYNTVRMYDSSLIRGGSGSKPLWRRIEKVVGHYASTFHIDGLMIDMAHALPEELATGIINMTRKISPDFAFWAEDFSRTEDQVRTGFNVVLGGQWACQHRSGDFMDMLAWIGQTPGLPAHLAAPETHNTPRAVTRPGGERYSRYAWAISCFIPGVPYIHSGYELYEARPVNTGLGFMPEDLALFPTEHLPLFSPHTLRWDALIRPPEWISRPLGIRERYRDLILAGPDAEFRLVPAGDPGIIAFQRSGGRRGLIVVANSDMEKRLNVDVQGSFTIPDPTDMMSGAVFSAAGGRLSGALEPGQVSVFAIQMERGS